MASSAPIYNCRLIDYLPFSDAPALVFGNDVPTCIGDLSSTYLTLVFNMTDTDMSYFYTTVGGSEVGTTSLFTSTYATSTERSFETGYFTAAPFMVRFKEEDFAAETTPPPGLSSPSSETSSQVTVATPSSTRGGAVSSEAPASSSAPDLSAGAKAGIGVGASVGGLTLVTIGAWLIWWRKRNASNSSSPFGFATPKNEAPLELQNRY